MLGDLERLLRLGGDLPFSDHDTIESAGHPEQVPDGFGVGVLIQVGSDLFGPDAVRLAEELGHQRRVDRAGDLRPGQVQLDPVARPEDDGLGPVPGGQLGQRPGPLGVVERQLLA